MEQVDTPETVCLCPFIFNVTSTFFFYHYPGLPAHTLNDLGWGYVDIQVPRRVNAAATSGIISMATGVMILSLFVTLPF